MKPSEAALIESATISATRPLPAGAAHWLTLLLVFAAGVAFRFLFLGCKPFWFDECFSVELARMDWRNFLHVLWWREANMSLYYALLRVWLHFGATQFTIRSLSVICASATLPAIYWLATQLFDRNVALIAAALFAVNDFDVRYSQEARSYALFLLLATLSSGFLILFLRRPARRWQVAYTLASILTVYAHFYALLLLVAHWLVLRYAGIPGGEESRSAIRADLRRAWITIGIAVSPLIIFVAKTGAGPIRWIQRPGVSDIFNFWKYFSGGVPVLSLAALIVIALPLRKRLWAKSESWEIWRVQFLAVWLLFPILITLLLSIARPVFYPRYMIFCLPAFLILFAAAMANLPSRWLVAASVCIVMFLSLRMMPFVYTHDLDDERDAAEQATNFILDHTQPGDGIIFHIPLIRVPYEFFRSLRSGQLSATREIGPEILYPRRGDRLVYLDLKSKLSADQLDSIVVGHPRVWVVLMYNAPKVPDPTATLLKQELQRSFPNVQSWQFTKVEVLLYSK